MQLRYLNSTIASFQWKLIEIIWSIIWIFLICLMNIAPIRNRLCAVKFPGRKDTQRPSTGQRGLVLDSTTTTRFRTEKWIIVWIFNCPKFIFYDHMPPIQFQQQTLRLKSEKFCRMLSKWPHDMIPPLMRSESIEASRQTLWSVENVTAGDSGH